MQDEELFLKKKFFNPVMLSALKINEIHILKVLHSKSTYLATSLLPTDCIISFGLIMMNLKQSTFGEKFILACGSDWKVKKLHLPLLSSERVSEWHIASSGKRQGAQVCLSDVLFLQRSHQDSIVVCGGW